MHYLTKDDIVRIHSTIRIGDKSLSGIQKEGLLESIPDIPKRVLFEKEIYPTIYLKGASLMEAIIRMHTFVEGNKRTGISAAKAFLESNTLRVHYPLHVTRLSVKIAKSEENSEKIIKKIAKFLDHYSLDLRDIVKSEQKIKKWREELEHLKLLSREKPDVFSRKLADWLVFDIYSENKMNITPILKHYLAKTEISITFYELLFKKLKNT